MQDFYDLIFRIITEKSEMEIRIGNDIIIKYATCEVPTFLVVTMEINYGSKIMGNY
jgi:hypothetical protein